MTILDFYNQVVLKTILVTPDMKYNKAHMALGMCSELTAELIEACLNDDTVNILEEIGDAEWFILGWGHFEELVIPSYSHMNIDNLITELSSEDAIDTYALVQVGKIATVVKNEIIKDKPKLDGKILTKQDKQELFENALKGIQILSVMFELDMCEVRQKIATKLNIRYAGGGFDANKSLDRDLETERKALEGNIDNQTVMDFGDE